MCVHIYIYRQDRDRVDTSRATVADLGRILFRELQTSLASVPPPAVTTIMAATMTTTGAQEDRNKQASQKLFLLRFLQLVDHNSYVVNYAKSNH